jgi:hypothetical protein
MTRQVSERGVESAYRRVVDVGFHSLGEIDGELNPNSI